MTVSYSTSSLAIELPLPLTLRIVKEGLLMFGLYIMRWIFCRKERNDFSPNSRIIKPVHSEVSILRKGNQLAIVHKKQTKTLKRENSGSDKYTPSKYK